MPVTKEMQEFDEMVKKQMARETEDAATWEKLGLSPEAAKIAARVEQQSAPKPIGDYQYADWQSLLDRLRR